MNTMKLTVWSQGDDFKRLVDNLGELDFHQQHGGPYAPAMLSILLKDSCYEALSAKVDRAGILRWWPLRDKNDPQITTAHIGSVRRITAHWSEDTP